METRILLADDQKIVREGLRLILESREDFRVVAEVSDGEEAVRRILEEKPDVAILELLMPRLSGLNAIRRLAREECETRCIVLSAHSGRRHAEEIVRAGAASYLLKSASSEELLSAVDTVREGRLYFSPAITQHVVEALARPNGASEPGSHALTGREHEVLELIAEGLSTKEIAGRLGVSPKTVDSHRSSLMEKLGIHKASCLVRYAIREGIVAA